MASLNKLELPDSFKGKYLGVLILAIVQTLVGVIHVVSGLILLFASNMLPLPIPVDVGYGSYTFLYGLLSVLFSYGLWSGKRLGWIGTLVSRGNAPVRDLLVRNPLVALGAQAAGQPVVDVLSDGLFGGLSQGLPPEWIGARHEPGLVCIVMSTHQKSQATHNLARGATEQAIDANCRRGLHSGHRVGRIHMDRLG